MQWKLPWSAIIIRSTIKIGFACKSLRVCTWSNGWVRFLCYLCELFTLFPWSIYAICALRKKKHGHSLWRVSHAGVGMLDRGFDWRAGRGLTWCTHTSDVGGRAGVVQPGRRGGRSGLPLPFGSPKLPIYLIYISFFIYDVLRSARHDIDISCFWSRCA
jgi:hypothetical protein